MERTLISWNVPNMITIPLMWAIAAIIVALVVQLYTKWWGANANDGKNPVVAGSGY